MQNFNIKENFFNYGWSTGCTFEIQYSRAGVARIFINDRKTSYHAGGGGYCKESSVIASMINDLIGYQNYSPDQYGNSQAYKGKKNERKLDGGTGFSSIQDSFESLRGCKIKQVYCGKTSDVFEIKFSKTVINRAKKREGIK